MVIEWLRFEVVPEAKASFIEKDQEIYTEFLANYPGFLGKEVWLNPKVENEVIIVAHWETREQWYSVPEKDLVAVEAKFAQAVGAENYQLLEVKEYQVRKFRHA